MSECLPPVGVGTLRDVLGFLFAAWGVLYLLYLSWSRRRAWRPLNHVLCSLGFCVGFSALIAALDAVPSAPRCAVPPHSQLLSDFFFWFGIGTVAISVDMARYYWRRFRGARRAQAVQRRVAGE